MVSFIFFGIVTPLVFDAALARPSFKNAMSLYPNITHVFPIDAACFPFEDPHCCIDRPVCECNNGTFYSSNLQQTNHTHSLCGPPGNVTYGEDSSNIPGFCC